MNSNKKESKSINYNAITAIIAIISMILTAFLTNRQINQSSLQFRETLERDSVLNESESEVVEKQLKLVKSQNMILDKQNAILDKTFRMDSILQNERIKVAKREYRLKIQEQRINDEINLNEINNFLLDFVLNSNIRENDLEKATNMQMSRWFDDINLKMQGQINNPIIAKNDKILTKWRKIMDNNKVQKALFLAIDRDASSGSDDIKKLKRAGWNTTFNGLVEIYSEVNKTVGNDPFFKIK